MLSALALSWSLLGTGLSQGEAISELADSKSDRIRTDISLVQESATSTPTETVITVKADNDGSVTIVKKGLMDIFVDYTAADGQVIAKRLTYSSNSPVGANEWTTTSISPDAFNPDLWDPGEQASFELRVTPKIKSGSTATVVVVTPNGVDSSQSFVNP